jgi:hypothetical protein
MKDIVKNLESKVTELRAELESKNAQMQEKDAKMEEKVTQLEAKNTQMEAKVQEQDSLLISLLREKNERTEAAGPEFVPTNQSAVAINGLPSSCGDLKMIGHIWNGIYSVMGSAMIESVYCDFSKLPSDAGTIHYKIENLLSINFISKIGFQTWIGYADVKSAPVHFYVLKESNFNRVTIPIPFELVLVNKGNAMNETTGIFTAPRTGIYFFSFTGLAYFPATIQTNFEVVLLLNGDLIVSGVVSDATTNDFSRSPLTVQSTLNLKSGDQIWMQIYSFSPNAYLEGINFHSYFTGFMLEEDIVASFLKEFV